MYVPVLERVFPPPYPYTELILREHQVLLIGLMSLPNQQVFMLIQPVVYLGKLNIEMSMASLIIKLARSDRSDAHPGPDDVDLRYHLPSLRTNNKAAPGGPDSLPTPGARDSGRFERHLALYAHTKSMLRASVQSSGTRTDEDEPGPPPAAPAVAGIQRIRECRRAGVPSSPATSLDEEGQEGGRERSGHSTEDEFWVTLPAV